MVFGLPVTISHRMHGNGQYVPTNLTIKINYFSSKIYLFVPWESVMDDISMKKDDGKPYHQRYADFVTTKSAPKGEVPKSGY